MFHNKYYKNFSIYNVYKEAIRDSHIKTASQLGKGQKTRDFWFIVSSYMSYYETNI